MTTGKREPSRGAFERRALILFAVSVGIGIVAAVASNWLVVTVMVLSAVLQLITIWLRHRR